MTVGSSPKQVIVLRTDLNMRKGKMVAQGAHASLKVFFDRLEISTHFSSGRKIAEWAIDNTAELDWVKEGFTKICVGVESEEQLLSLYEKAKAAGLLCSVVKDAGKTEFGGIATYTAIAIGPDLPEKIDP